jgi:hypothetical protein
MGGPEPCRRHVQHQMLEQLIENNEELPCTQEEKSWHMSAGGGKQLWSDMCAGGKVTLVCHVIGAQVVDPIGPAQKQTWHANSSSRIKSRAVEANAIEQQQHSRPPRACARDAKCTPTGLTTARCSPCACMARLP